MGIAFDKLYVISRMSYSSAHLFFTPRHFQVQYHAIFTGSTISLCLQTTCSNRIPKGTQNRHFLRLSMIWYLGQVYIIRWKIVMWCLTSQNTIQSSKYTSRNLWINSLNSATTTCENITGVFFNPNEIMVYWKQPHLVPKVSLLLSSGVIFIWCYPENPSVKEYAS